MYWVASFQLTVSTSALLFILRKDYLKAKFSKKEGSFTVNINRGLKKYTHLLLLCFKHMNA